MNDKEIRLLEECELASAVLKSGLHSLRHSSIFDKGVLYRAFFELSIAIERVLKIIIIMEFRIKNDGEFPSLSNVDIKGHRLLELWKKADLIELKGVHKIILEWQNIRIGRTNLFFACCV